MSEKNTARFRGKKKASLVLGATHEGESVTITVHKLKGKAKSHDKLKASDYNGKKPLVKLKFDNIKALETFLSFGMMAHEKAVQQENGPDIVLIVPVPEFEPEKLTDEEMISSLPDDQLDTLSHQVAKEIEKRNNTKKPAETITH